MDNQRLNFLLEKFENQTTNLAEQKEIDEFYQSFDKQPNYTDSVANLKDYEQFNALKMSAIIDARKGRVIKLKYWIRSAAVACIALALFIVLKPKAGDVNTVTTEKGETKQVELPDGSLIILNAASTLTYSVNFIKEQTRLVQLSGEAYFEVKKDKLHPFIVKTQYQKVEVLGTRFNVNAYREEKNTITTLFEGSIKITTSNINPKGKSAQLLVPGQKAILKGGIFNITPAKEENIVAWKNGVFCFDEESLQRIMNKIGRWYGVDIVYLDGVDKVENFDELFNGRVSKSAGLQRILKIIERVAPIQFTVKEDSVIVKFKQ